MTLHKLSEELMQLAPLSRRRFIQRALIGGPTILTGCRVRESHRRPNILFCISDDQSYPHASAYGATFLSTPAFDRVASEGVLFHNCFVSTPSCCPSRGSVLAGQDFYRLREASMNHTVWPGGIEIYPDVLAEAGYHAGFTGKGWGPGNWRVSGRSCPPVGPPYNEIRLQPPAKFISEIDYAANFEAFLKQCPEDTPFCFWAGFVEPHHPFDAGIGVRSGKKLEEMPVPDFFPDSPAVRGDIADYAFEIEYYDKHLGRMLNTLERRGELDNTIVVVTADNGMAFPRAKATLYDYGTRMPAAIRWGARVRPGREVRDFISFTDFAPTFCEAAGVPIPAGVTGRSLMSLLTAPSSGQVDPVRDHAVFGIERHFPGSRPNGAGYPMRALRTAEYLYIRNLTPEQTPVGDHPGAVWPDDDPTGGYGDTDGSPTKTCIWEKRDELPSYARMAFAKRPGEELYKVTEDPYNMKNLAAEPAFTEIKTALARRLDEHLRRTEDPRATGNAEVFDEIMQRYPVIGSNQ